MEMDLSQVKTAGDFRSYVLFLAHEKASTTNRSLEEYLRALWGRLQQVRGAKVTFALLGKLLDDAFFAKPLPFDENWLHYETPPGPYEEQGEPFVVLQRMICYQISDLHRMAQTGQINDPNGFFGIDSPTGQRWYNFDPYIYLKCGAQSLRESNTSIDADWRDLAILLEFGQSYE